MATVTRWLVDGMYKKADNDDNAAIVHDAYQKLRRRELDAMEKPDNMTDKDWEEYKDFYGGKKEIGPVDQPWRRMEYKSIYDTDEDPGWEPIDTSKFAPVDMTEFPPLPPPLPTVPNGDLNTYWNTKKAIKRWVEQKYPTSALKDYVDFRPKPKYGPLKENPLPVDHHEEKKDTISGYLGKAKDYISKNYPQLLAGPGVGLLSYVMLGMMPSLKRNKMLRLLLAGGAGTAGWLLAKKQA